MDVYGTTMIAAFREWTKAMLYRGFGCKMLANEGVDGVRTRVRTWISKGSRYRRPRTGLG
jgi:hypothetical protein